MPLMISGWIRSRTQFSPQFASYHAVFIGVTRAPILHSELFVRVKLEFRADVWHSLLFSCHQCDIQTRFMANAHAFTHRHIVQCAHSNITIIHVPEYWIPMSKYTHFFYKNKSNFHYFRFESWFILPNHKKNVHTIQHVYLTYCDDSHNESRLIWYVNMCVSCH